MTTYNDQFIKMPMRILSISHINGIKFSDNSKTLYCYLKGFDKAFPSYSKIGEVFGISARAAEERVKKLVELGLVIKTRRFSSSNLYEVLEIPGQEESNEVGQTPDMPEIVDSFFFDDTEEDTTIDNFEDVQPSPPPKIQANSPFECKSPRDETKDWFYLKHYQGAERFTTFTDFDLPYLALFKAQGSLTNPYALDYLQLRTDQIQQQLARNT
ncbi:transcriptional regulator [Klebsiella quasipneumoniae subsp. similipneumoniae]|uniref:helix-turn-helix domain-containing protein n=1 Tax=Klebsiella quasipneumoniae TaxID=1463165 RepID=UPI0035ABB050